MAREDTFTRRLVEKGLDAVPARKAAQVMEYYAQARESEDFLPTQRISRIWIGMGELGIEPYIKAELTRSGMTPSSYSPEELIYLNLDSIAVGIAVCLDRGLLNTCEYTSYALSAKGVEFIGEGD